MAAETKHCKYCGDELTAYGFTAHENACRKATDEHRQALRELRARRLAIRNGQPKTVQEGISRQLQVEDKKLRLRLCVSVSLEQFKLLLPFIEIDKVEIA